MLTLDLWSDVVCPWCWIGKHRLEAAVKSLGLEGQVQLRFHAYELGGREKSGLGVHEHLVLKYGISRQEAVEMTDRVEKVGAELGLSFDFAKAHSAPTFDAHRLVQAAEAADKGPQMMERLHRAHFAEGKDVSDPATLRALALEVGLAASKVGEVLEGQAFAAEVEEAEERAVAYEIRGVPFTVMNGRLAVPGAQPVETFEKAIQQAQAMTAKEG
jgi:predicted DsbA family dithiol-disulfide isomerase